MAYKKNYRCFLHFSIMLCLTVFCSCKREQEDTIYRNQESLNKEMEQRIIRDWKGLTGGDSNIKIEKYYGTYNDLVVVMMGGGYTTAPWDTIIADTLINYSDGRSIQVWKEGLFYGLRDAYDLGLLTREDIRSIAAIHNYRESNLENHAGLRWDIAYGIIITYFNVYIKPHYPDAVLGEDSWNVWIENYYGYYQSVDLGGGAQAMKGGLYNDYVAVMMDSKYIMHTDAAWETAVAGIPFRYNNGNRILLWKTEEPNIIQGRFYELQDAYDEGLLTIDDIKSIIYYHENGKTIIYFR